MAPIVHADGAELGEDALIVNLSVDGAFLQTARAHPVGTPVNLKFELPTGKGKAIPVSGEIVRAEDGGLGIRFSDIRSRDRSLLREYAHFSEMDDMVVRVQRKVGGHAAGNLLPLCDRQAIETRLRAAANRRLPVMVVDPFRNDDPLSAVIGLSDNGLLLHDLERPLKPSTRAVYIIITDGPMQFMFEGLLAETGPVPRILEPERMYHNERRAGDRVRMENAWMELAAPHLGERPLRLEVVDFSEGGCSVRASRQTIIIPGMRFPEFSLHFDGRPRRYGGATVKRLIPGGPEEWLVGLNFADDALDRDAFSDVRKRSIRPTLGAVLSRVTGVVRQKVRSIVVRGREDRRDQVCVTRYKNERGDQVAALLDATFDPRADVTDVDVAVVVAPAFLRRKEVFSLLARTLVDNFKEQKLSGVVLRFDATHTVGESFIDPDLEAAGTPYLRWTFSHLKSDMKASLQHLERRFRPKKRVMVTFSVASMAARRYIADGGSPPVDLWVSPFGCPDAQDMFRNYLAGIDLFQNYLGGRDASPFLIYGRLADPNHVFPDAMKNGMAFLEQAREDMSRIKCPVVWIVGTYDYMVTQERVRQMLAAPGGGVREVFRLDSGHVLKTGDEAIESFKLIGESISKHLFGRDRAAVEPDMAAYIRQNDAEWGRIKSGRLGNAADFWNRHLFGTGDKREGYDVLLYNPAYVDFLDRQAELLEARQGDRVADVGCGTGNMSAALTERAKGRGFRLRFPAWTWCRPPWSGRGRSWRPRPGRAADSSSTSA
jgi:hypothetical protein